MVVVPAPISTTAAPISASSSVRTARPETYGLAAIASTLRWQRSTTSIRFLATVASAVIEDGTGLDAARLDLAVADQLDGVGTATQGVVRRARLEPRNHARNLAGADVKRSHERGALARHWTRLRRLGAR